MAYLPDTSPPTLPSTASPCGWPFLTPHNLGVALPCLAVQSDALIGKRQRSTPHTQHSASTCGWFFSNTSQPGSRPVVSGCVVGRSKWQAAGVDLSYSTYSVCVRLFLFQHLTTQTPPCRRPSDNAFGTIPRTGEALSTCEGFTTCSLSMTSHGHDLFMPACTLGSRAYHKPVFLRRALLYVDIPPP